MLQLEDYRRWAAGMSYGLSWIVESAFQYKRNVWQGGKGQEEEQHGSGIAPESFTIQYVCDVKACGRPTGRYWIMWICATEQH